MSSWHTASGRPCASVMCSSRSTLTRRARTSRWRQWRWCRSRRRRSCGGSRPCSRSALSQGRRSAACRNRRPLHRQHGSRLVPPSGRCTTRRCRHGPVGASTNSHRDSTASARGCSPTTSFRSMSWSGTAASPRLRSGPGRQRGHRHHRLVRGVPGRCAVRPRHPHARPRGAPRRRPRRLRRRCRPRPHPRMVVVAIPGCGPLAVRARLRPDRDVSRDRRVAITTLKQHEPPSRASALRCASARE